MNDRNDTQLFDSWSESCDDAVASSDHPFPFGGYRQVLDEVAEQAGAVDARRLRSFLQTGGR